MRQKIQGEGRNSILSGQEPMRMHTNSARQYWSCGTKFIQRIRRRNYADLKAFTIQCHRLLPLISQISSRICWECISSIEASIFFPRYCLLVFFGVCVCLLKQWSWSHATSSQLFHEQWLWRFFTCESPTLDLRLFLNKSRVYSSNIQKYSVMRSQSCCNFQRLAFCVLIHF